MAGSRPRDPLDALQLMVNDVLIQTAKTLKNMSKDGTKGSGQMPSNLKPKLDATSRIFHAALDDLESEIIAAKSVFMRDLSVIRHKKAAATSQASAPVGQPVPQKQAPAAPMSIDMESPNLTSGAVNRQQQQQQDQSTIMSKANSSNGIQNKRDIRPAAPFPDMGMGMGMEGASAAASVDVAGSTKDKAACANPPGRGTPKPACVAHSRPQPNPTKTPVAPMGIGPAPPTSAAAPRPSPTPPLPNPASSASKTINTKTATSGPEVPTLPFTDMEFSLAPSSDPPELTSLSVPGGSPAAPTALMGDMNTFNITSAPPPPQPQQQQNSQKTGAAPASMGGGVVVVSTPGPQTTTTMTTMPANPGDTVAQQKLPLTAPAKTTVDDMYTLGDLDTDIGGGGPGGTDTNFDDVFTSYDPSYFGVE